MFFLSTTIVDLFQYVKYQNSKELVAEIDRLEKVVVTAGPSFAKHKIKVRYHYEFKNKKYYSSNVSIYGDKGTFGFDDELYKKLKIAYDKGNVVSCYVVENDPDSPVLSRDADGKLVVFFSAMTLAWGGALSFMWKATKYEFKNV